MTNHPRAQGRLRMPDVVQRRFIKRPLRLSVPRRLGKQLHNPGEEEGIGAVRWALRGVGAGDTTLVRGDSGGE